MSAIDRIWWHPNRSIASIYRLKEGLAIVDKYLSVQYIIPLPHDSSVSCVAYDSTGELLCVLQSGSPTVTIYSLTNKAIDASFDMPLSPPTSCAWHPDQPLLAMGTSKGSVVVYSRVTKKKQTFTGRHGQSNIPFITWFDGFIFSVGEDSRVQLSTADGAAVDEVKLPFPLNRSSVLTVTNHCILLCNENCVAVLRVNSTGSINILSETFPARVCEILSIGAKVALLLATGQLMLLEILQGTTLKKHPASTGILGIASHQGTVYILTHKDRSFSVQVYDEHMKPLDQEIIDVTDLIHISNPTPESVKLTSSWAGDLAISSASGTVAVLRQSCQSQNAGSVCSNREVTAVRSKPNEIVVYDNDSKTQRFVLTFRQDVKAVAISDDYVTVACGQVISFYSVNGVPVKENIPVDFDFESMVLGRTLLLLKGRSHHILSFNPLTGLAVLEYPDAQITPLTAIGGDMFFTATKNSLCVTSKNFLINKTGFTQTYELPFIPETIKVNPTGNLAVLLNSSHRLLIWSLPVHVARGEKALTTLEPKEAVSDILFCGSQYFACVSPKFEVAVYKFVPYTVDSNISTVIKVSTVTSKASPVGFEIYMDGVVTIFLVRGGNKFESIRFDPVVSTVKSHLAVLDIAGARQCLNNDPKNPSPLEVKLLSLEHEHRIGQLRGWSNHLLDNSQSAIKIFTELKDNMNLLSCLIETGDFKAAMDLLPKYRPKDNDLLMSFLVYAQATQNENNHQYAEAVNNYTKGGSVNSDPRIPLEEINISPYKEREVIWINAILSQSIEPIMTITLKHTGSYAETLSQLSQRATMRCLIKSGDVHKAIMTANQNGLLEMCANELESQSYFAEAGSILLKLRSESKSQDQFTRAIDCFVKANMLDLAVKHVMNESAQSTELSIPQSTLRSLASGIEKKHPATAAHLYGLGKMIEDEVRVNIAMGTDESIGSAISAIRSEAQRFKQLPAWLISSCEYLSDRLINLGDFKNASELLLLASHESQAVQLAIDKNACDHLNVHLLTKSSIDKIRQFYTNQREHFKCARMLEMAKQNSAAMEEAIKAIELQQSHIIDEEIVAFFAHSKHDTTLLERKLQQLKQTHAPTAYFILKSVRQSEEAMGIAATACKVLCTEGEYKSARRLVCDAWLTLKGLPNQDTLFAKDIYIALVNIMSYVSVKACIERQDHIHAAMLLRRCAENQSWFPKHAAQILIAGFGECTSAGMQKEARDFAVALLRLERQSQKSESVATQVIPRDILKHIESAVRRSDIHPSYEERKIQCLWCESMVSSESSVTCLSCGKFLPLCSVTFAAIDPRDQIMSCKACTTLLLSIYLTEPADAKTLSCSICFSQKLLPINHDVDKHLRQYLKLLIDT